MKVMMLVSPLIPFINIFIHPVIFFQLFGRGMMRRARLQIDVVDEMMPDIEKLDQIGSMMAHQ